MIAALLLVLAAQDASPEAPPERRDLSETAAELRAKHDLPALMGAVYHGGRVTAFGLDGVRERGSDVALTFGDKVHIGSCTKSMTATLAATYVEEGALAWDSTLAEVFDDLARRMHADWRDVTLADLLMHRSGAARSLDPYPALAPRVRGVDRRLPKMRATVVKELTSEEPPGLRGDYVYSNYGYVLAAAMIERVSGDSWEEGMRERLFEPLGMTSAGFGPPSSEKKLDQPRGHWESGEPAKRRDNPATMSPAGRVHLTLEDWFRYLALHMDGANGKQGLLLEPATLQAMHTPPEDVRNTYAMGWQIFHRGWGGGDVLSHNGSNTAWYAWVWIAPERDFIVLAVTNQGGPAAGKACDELISALIEDHLTQ